MIKQKPIYLMSGGRGASEKATTSIMQAVFREIGKASPTIAYVGAASDDNWVFYKFVSGMIQKAGDCHIARVALSSKKADLQKARNALQSADAIFMSGGDVERGMEILQEKLMADFLRELFQQGKLFFGSSAGSIMLAREWVRWRDPDDESTAELFPCLGLAPVICDTHAEGDHWEELKAALHLKGDGAQGYGIATGTCLKVGRDGKLEALGGPVSLFRKVDQTIARQPDILPIRT
jgi:peptidase E